MFIEVKTLVATLTPWLVLLNDIKYFRGVSVGNWQVWSRQTSSCCIQQPVSASVSHEDGCLLFLPPPSPHSSSFSPAAFCFSSRNPECLFCFVFSPVSSFSLPFPPTHVLSGLFFCCFHAELEFIRIWIETCRHMKKGKYYLNWGIKNPELSCFFFRVLSPCFLKERVLYCLGNPVYCCHRCI